MTSPESWPVTTFLVASQRLARYMSHIAFAGVSAQRTVPLLNGPVSATSAKVQVLAGFS